MPKEGEVNNKKKTKYCSVCNTWFPFSLWKKHGQSHVNEVLESSGWSTAAEPTWEEKKLAIQREQIEKLEQANKRLNEMVHKFNMERESANRVLKAVGELLVAQHS